MTSELQPLIHSYTTSDADLPPLLCLMRRHVDRLSQHMPEAYFELGRRCPESLDSLTHRVFLSCRDRARPGRPFRERPPFRCYVEEQLEERPIRFLTFYGHLSVAREELRRDYAFNIRRDPELKRRDELYRDLGSTLERRCEAVKAGRRTLWRAPTQGPQRVRSEVDTIRLARGEAPGLDFDDLVVRTLELRGTPMSRSKLAHLLAEVLPAAPGDAPQEEARPRPAQALAVRGALRRVWAGLDPADRRLIVAVARGASGDELQAIDPRMQNGAGVSRALKRLGAQFVAAMGADLGVDPDPAKPPRELLETIIEVLLLSLPELENVPPVPAERRHA